MSLFRFFILSTLMTAHISSIANTDTQTTNQTGKSRLSNDLLEQSITTLRLFLIQNDVYDYQDDIEKELNAIIQILKNSIHDKHTIEITFNKLRTIVEQANQRDQSTINSDAAQKAQWGFFGLGTIFAAGYLWIPHIIEAIQDKQTIRIIYPNGRSNFETFQFDSTYDRIFHGSTGVIMTAFLFTFLNSHLKNLKRFICFSKHLEYRQQFMYTLLNKINELEQEVMNNYK